jgi:hypothetical protein
LLLLCCPFFFSSFFETDELVSEDKLIMPLVVKEIRICLFLLFIQRAQALAKTLSSIASPENGECFLLTRAVQAGGTHHTYEGKIFDKYVSGYNACVLSDVDGILAPALSGGRYISLVKNEVAVPVWRGIPGDATGL